MKKLSLILGALALALGGAVAQAQIKRLTLDELTTATDNGVVGTIVARRVIDLGNERDGLGLYFTVLTIQGESLYDGRKITVDVVKNGGWIDASRGIGSWDSEAPSDEETAIGKKVVAYYRWSKNIANGVGANILYAAHGSLFRTVEGPSGTVVLGRGDGYAVSKNMKLASLQKATRAIIDAQAAQGK